MSIQTGLRSIAITLNAAGDLHGEMPHLAASIHDGQSAKVNNAFTVTDSIRPVGANGIVAKRSDGSGTYTLHRLASGEVRVVIKDYGRCSFAPKSMAGVEETAVIQPAGLPSEGAYPQDPDSRGSVAI
jgi:hypothetical protein